MNEVGFGPGQIREARQSAVTDKAAKDANGNDHPPDAGSAPGRSANGNGQRKNGGWQQVEALRERAALKASLADVWDEDFDLDEEILAELDHKAEFFTQQGDVEEDIPDDDDVDDEFFEDDEV